MDFEQIPVVKYKRIRCSRGGNPYYNTISSWMGTWGHGDCCWASECCWSILGAYMVCPCFSPMISNFLCLYEYVSTACYMQIYIHTGSAPSYPKEASFSSDTITVLYCTVITCVSCETMGNREYCVVDYNTLQYGVFSSPLLC